MPVSFQNEFQAAPRNAPRRPLDEHDAGMTSTDPLKFVDTKALCHAPQEAKKNSA